MPWVAHFSDPWSQHPGYRSGLTRDTLSRYEQQIFERADRLIFVNELMRDTILSGASDEIKAKARVIARPVDARMFAPAIALPQGLTREPNAKIVAHVGSFGRLRIPEPFLTGVRKLIEQQPDAARRPQVWLVGAQNPAEENGEAIPGVQYLPPVSYAESLAVMRAADVLLVLKPPVRKSMFFPSKLTDYLLAGKPLLALTPKNSYTSTLMEQWKQPWCEVRNAGALAEKLQRIAGGELWVRPPPESARDAFESKRGGAGVGGGFCGGTKANGGLGAVHDWM